MYSARKNGCDLHTHSIFSDGSCTPREIVESAKEMGLSAVALTDHNTAAGLPDFLAAAREQGITPVAGIEISCDFLGKEIHLLGLFLAEKTLPAVTEFVEQANRRKEQSNRDLIKKLQERGYAITYEQVKAANPQATRLNRANIAAFLEEQGLISSMKEAIEGLLSKEGGLYEPPLRTDGLEAVAFLRTLGAVPVLAHPLLSLDEAALREFLPRAAEAGLAGMETRYSTYTREQEALADRLAEEFSLLPSGGSDFHGSRKPDIALGVGRGNLFVPTAYYERLKNAR